MIKFIVPLFLLLFLSSCSFNNIYENTLNTIKKNNKSYSSNKLSDKKLSASNQASYLKNLIKNDPMLINTLSPDQILNLLGIPKIIKKQRFMEIWQYRDKCILNIVWEKDNSKDYLKKFLYNADNLDYSNLDYKIVWIESLSTNRQKLSNEACFFELAHIM